MRTFLCAILAATTALRISAEEAIDIGTRRELFVDKLLVGKFKNTELKLHSPTLLKRTEKQRPSGHYATVLKSERGYQFYYRGDAVPGMHWKKDGWGPYHANEVTEYAESSDGYSWTEPNLGLYDYPGMPEGNVILADQFLVTHNFTPFIDDRPGIPEDEKYKAIGGGKYPDENWALWPDKDTRAKLREKYGVGGLYGFVSPDGIHWKKIQEKAIIPETEGNFDSQNVVFWSEAEGQYVAFFRILHKGLRSIRKSTSQDFLTWTEPVLMEANMPGEHLYTNGTHPYFRAPHIYIALPTRFQANRSSITDVVFMSLRPGSTKYERTFKEAFIRPGLGEGGWGNRSNYVALNVVPTGKDEMSLYMYGGGHYTMRTDGFISVSAGYEEGSFLTKPLIFGGNKLEINSSTSAAGMIRVEIQDLEGNPNKGFTLEDSEKIWGDEVSRIVKWNHSADLSALAGQPVRLRFVMNEADLYSIRFPEISE